MSHDIKAAAAIAGEAARIAGKALDARGREFQGIAASDGRDIKLYADKAAEKLILTLLQERSSFPVLSEEAGWSDKKSGPVWIVDPLDGSANYNRKIPLCCVSIALVDGFTPLLGAIYDFNCDDLYIGIPDEGATLNGEAIQVSEIDQKKDAVLMTGLPVQSDFSSETMTSFALNLPHWKKVRLIGSAALSLAFVSSGKADRYQENGIMFWDVAAGCALVKAAGGRIQIDGDALDKPMNVTADNGSFGT